MHKRATELIADLGLQPHPEGGYFRENFRSSRKVQPLDERSPRSALTTIYFLLVKGQHSRWHRVASDEAWHFYEGDPLELWWIAQDDEVHEEVLASGVSGAHPASFRRAAGRQRGRVVSLVSWDAPSGPGSTSRISR